MNIVSADQLVGVFRNTIVSLVQRPGADLTSRQLGVFLTCYLEPEAQTVRGLASALHVSKPAISRALDRLAQFDLIRRRHDEADRRSVLVQRTSRGNALMRDLTKIIGEAAADTESVPASQPVRVRRTLKAAEAA